MAYFESRSRLPWRRSSYMRRRLEPAAGKRHLTGKRPPTSRTVDAVVQVPFRGEGLTAAGSSLYRRGALPGEAHLDRLNKGTHRLVRVANIRGWLRLNRYSGKKYRYDKSVRDMLLDAIDCFLGVIALRIRKCADEIDDGDGGRIRIRRAGFRLEIF